MSEIDPMALLAGTAGLIARSKVVELGEHSFRLYEVPAQVAWDYNAELMEQMRAQKAREASEEEETEEALSARSRAQSRRVAAQVARMLLPPEKQRAPSEAEIDALIASLSDGIIAQLYTEGADFNDLVEPVDKAKND